MKVLKSRKGLALASVSFAAAKSRLVAIGLASVAVLLSHGNAQAKDPPCFSQAAVTMIPVPEASDRNYELKIMDGRVRLIGGASVVLHAPVLNLTGKRDVGWTHFAVLYTDPDGRGQIDESKSKEPNEEWPRTNDARVQAVLKFVDESGSPPQKVEKVELDSNEARAETEERAKETRHMRVKIPKETKLNFEKHYYFVEITLTREDHKDNQYEPDVLGFKLCKQGK